MKRVFLSAAILCGLAIPAAAQGLQWVSAPVFMGQTSPGSKTLYWLPAIMSTTPDGTGNYELWVQNIPHYQESYADAIAVKARALCDKSGSNSCVSGQSTWSGYLIPTITPVQ
jgi:hypothetical protein